MINIELLSKLCEQEPYFKDNEKESERIATIEQGKFLCIRLDGIGLSKKYLKDKIKTNQFDGAMWQALEDTYHVLHRKAPTDAQNIFLASLICSDEVSIILNSQKNYYEGRLFKTVTTFSSTFSSFFTRNGFNKKRKKNEQIIGGSFDGRPLVFSGVDEIANYMAFRYAIFIRNTASKLLRLNNVSISELYSEKNKNNINYYFNKINELSLISEFNDLAKLPIVFIPEESGVLTSHRYISLNEFVEDIPKKLMHFDLWLRNKCT